MITWMQKKKKYLIVTIWVSTIAFIGAGFVGWGAYDYGSKASSIAKVGDVDVKMKDLQRTYSNLFGYYRNMFNGKFDKDMAKQFGLEKQSMNLLINQALMINLANEFDLVVSDNELFNAIADMEQFQKELKFDKETYKNTLLAMQMSPSEFEDVLRKDLLIQKVSSLLSPIVTPLEIEAVKSALNVSDKISYMVLDSMNIKVDTNEELLKAFWEQNQQKYQTQVKYDIEIAKYPAFDGEVTDKELRDFYNLNRFDFQDDDAKIPEFDTIKVDVEKKYRLDKVKKDALRAYIDYKKEGNTVLDIDKHSLAINNGVLDEDIMKEIQVLDDNQILKPKEMGNKYVIIKKLKMVEARQKTYEEAKFEVTTEYIDAQKQKLLQEKADKLVNNFNGKDSEFLSRDTKNPLDGLTLPETQSFINQLFSQNSLNGQVNLDKKIIIYSILEQKLLDKNFSDDEKKSLDQNALSMKKSLYESGVLEQLKNKNEIEIYYEGQ